MLSVSSATDDITIKLPRIGQRMARSLQLTRHSQSVGHPIRRRFTSRSNGSVSTQNGEPTRFLAVRTLVGALNAEAEGVVGDAAFKLCGGSFPRRLS